MTVAGAGRETTRADERRLEKILSGARKTVNLNPDRSD
jgi:hypothetical protein